MGGVHYDEEDFLPFSGAPVKFADLSRIQVEAGRLFSEIPLPAQLLDMTRDLTVEETLNICRYLSFLRWLNKQGLLVEGALEKATPEFRLYPDSEPAVDE
jgi:hypothetical protein